MQHMNTIKLEVTKEQLQIIIDTLALADGMLSDDACKIATELWSRYCDIYENFDHTVAEQR